MTARLQKGSPYSYSADNQDLQIATWQIMWKNTCFNIICLMWKQLPPPSHTSESAKYECKSFKYKPLATIQYSDSPFYSFRVITLRITARNK